ncbi:MAG: type VI secretion system-associated FHA domain protein [Shinella sp.]|uniref:type VI secretion system-associated FHA domain protein n=1 Tax=Shinella sp. TaxID=1870904 RepID=UPI004035DDA0
MQLRLVLKGPERLTTGIRERTVETGAVVIGRSAEADWVLSDPERIVSKLHCRIERQGGGFLLTDMSTNGVLVNGVPIGREASRMLVDKDVLTLGDAIIAVAIETETPDVVPLPATDDPFAGGPFGFDEVVAEAVKVGIVQDVAAENARDKVAVLQDWWIPTAESRNGEPKPVDISGGMGNASIARTNAAGEAVASATATGTNLAAEALGLDEAVFAKAVETAMLVLSAEEKRRFEGRLFELLRKEKSG